MQPDSFFLLILVSLFWRWLKFHDRAYFGPFSSSSKKTGSQRPLLAAPGLTPFRIKAAAMGVEAVAQTYNGIILNLARIAIDSRKWNYKPDSLCWEDKEVAQLIFWCVLGSMDRRESETPTQIYLQGQRKDCWPSLRSVAWPENHISICWRLHHSR